MHYVGYFSILGVCFVIWSVFYLWIWARAVRFVSLFVDEVFRASVCCINVCVCVFSQAGTHRPKRTARAQHPNMDRVSSDGHLSVTASLLSSLVLTGAAPSDTFLSLRVKTAQSLTFWSSSIISRRCHDAKICERAPDFLHRSSICFGCILKVFTMARLHCCKRTPRSSPDAFGWMKEQQELLLVLLVHAGLMSSCHCKAFISVL